MLKITVESGRVLRWLNRLQPEPAGATRDVFKPFTNNLATAVLVGASVHQ